MGEPSDQWWWRQCSDMQFYEKMQEHMDICNELKVINRETLKWHAAQDVAGDVEGVEIICSVVVVVACVCMGTLTKRSRRVVPVF